MGPIEDEVVYYSINSHTYDNEAEHSVHKSSLTDKENDIFPILINYACIHQRLTGSAGDYSNHDIIEFNDDFMSNDPLDSLFLD